MDNLTQMLRFPVGCRVVIQTADHTMGALDNHHGTVTGYKGILVCVKIDVLPHPTVGVELPGWGLYESELTIVESGGAP